MNHCVINEIIHPEREIEICFNKLLKAVCVALSDFPTHQFSLTATPRVFLIKDANAKHFHVHSTLPTTKKRKLGDKIGICSDKHSERNAFFSLHFFYFHKIEYLKQNPKRNSLQFVSCRSLIETATLILIFYPLACHYSSPIA